MDRQIAADPFGEPGAYLHVFFVARPIGGWPEICRDLVGEAKWRQQLRELMHGSWLDEPLRALRDRMYPGQPVGTYLGGLTQLGKTERGAQLSNRVLPAAAAGGHDPGTTALEISEDGELRFIHIGAGRPAEVNGVRYTGLYADVVALIVREMLAVTLAISGHAEPRSSRLSGAAVQHGRLPFTAYLA